MENFQPNCEIKRTEGKLRKKQFELVCSYDKNSSF